MAMSELQNYTLIQHVGKGAFGVVNLCRHNTSNQQVIIKEIQDCYSNNTYFLPQANNEIEVLSKMHHPNVIQYYHHFYNNGSMFIVMEYADCGTLSQHISWQKESIHEKEVLNLFSQILLGLDHIHSMNIVHRDIKTENVFLAQGNIIKIGDFGVSKILNEHSKAFTVIGTPFYLAPELCENKPYNCKSDMWALGCILYELCTFKKAFTGESLAGLVSNIMSGRVSKISGYYSQQLWDIIQWLLNVDPDFRPNCSQVMGHPIVARHVYPRLLGITIDKVSLEYC